MASRTNAPYTAGQGRRFGFTVGLAFAVFAGLAWWRDHPTTTMILAGLAGVLIVSAMAVPAYLGPVERKWMAFAHLISKVTTPIVMGAMYLGVLLPTGVLRRTFGGNPMHHAAGDGSYWKKRERRASDLTRQY